MILGDLCDYLLSFVTFKLNNEFKNACMDAQIIRLNCSLKEYLELYGLFKRSLYGKCHSTTFVDSPEKREYWDKCNHLSIRAAKKMYIDLVNSLKLKYDTGLSHFGSISKMNINDDMDSSNPLYIFQLVNTGDISKLSELLNERPSLISTKGDDGMTLLHLASDRDHVDIVKLLLEFGMDVNVKDNFGDSPLDVANIANSQNCIDLLVLHGGVANNTTHN